MNTTDFWKEKLDEQSQVRCAEINQLHKKLDEFYEYAAEIKEIKKKFMRDEKQYHGVLNVWKSELDAIFLVAERLTK